MGVSAAIRLRADSDLYRSSLTAAIAVATASSRPAGPYHEAVSLAVVGEVAVASPVAR
jgi:hypothetical protein